MCTKSCRIDETLMNTFESVLSKQPKGSVRLTKASALAQAVALWLQNEDRYSLQTIRENDEFAAKLSKSGSIPS